MAETVTIIYMIAICVVQKNLIFIFKKLHIYLFIICRGRR